jgi:hypothetical protein
MSRCKSTWTHRGIMVRFLAAARDFSLRQRIQSDSATYPTSYSMVSGEGGCSSWGKGARSWSSLLIPSNDEFKNEWSCACTPSHAFTALLLDVINISDLLVVNFTFKRKDTLKILLMFSFHCPRYPADSYAHIWLVCEKFNYMKCIQCNKTCVTFNIIFVPTWEAANL